MSLIEITELAYPILLDMRYATKNNFTGRQIYQTPRCFLHVDAIDPFERAVTLAAKQGLRLKIMDAYRPQYAQEMFWSICPDANYIMPPTQGSHHTRGVAIDLTLINEHDVELDMGTHFDDFREASHHGSLEISTDAARNRYLLLGIMMSAGWDLFVNEWWHYQLFNARQYSLIEIHPALVAA